MPEAKDDTSAVRTHVRVLEIQDFRCDGCLSDWHGLGIEMRFPKVDLKVCRVCLSKMGEDLEAMKH